MSNQTKRQPVECFSRIVGYLRPISQWNDGKLSEWNERVNFNEKKLITKK